MLPKILQPNDFELFHVKSEEVEIPKCKLIFNKWEGVPVKETFGGKPLINLNNKSVFAEIAILNLLLQDGWQARWVSTYGSGNKNPKLLASWVDDKYKNQNSTEILDKKIKDLLIGISEENNNSYSGCWDVLAWKDEQIIFAESKRNKKDKIRQTQINWLEAGLQLGLKPENFLVVQWDFLTE